MKGTICRIYGLQLGRESVYRLKKPGPAPISGLRVLLLCSWLLHYTDFQPLPPLAVPEGCAGGYYLKKGR